MTFHRTFLILIFLSIVGPSSQDWFTEKMTSPFKFLKEFFFGKSVFAMDHADEIHEELTTKFLERKDDGLALTYNLIYYNLILNLERECYSVAGSILECEAFSNHMKNIITNNVKTGKEGYNYILIEQLFNMLFDVSRVDPNDEQCTQLNELLPKLREHFDGQLFEETKTKLTYQYNEVLKNLMHYLTNNEDKKDTAILGQEFISQVAIGNFESPYFDFEDIYISETGINTDHIPNEASEMGLANKIK